MFFYNVFFNFTHHSSIAEHRNKRKSSQRCLATDIEERSQLSGTATPSSSVSVLQYTYPEFTTESCEQLLNTKKPIRTSQWINSQRQEEQQQQLESRRSYGIGGAGNIRRPSEFIYTERGEKGEKESRRKSSSPLRISIGGAGKIPKILWKRMSRTKVMETRH